MTDYADFIDAIAGDLASQQVAAANPYTGFKSIPDSISTMVLNSSSGLKGKDRRDAFKASAVSGLVSGILGSLSDNWAASRKASYLDVLKHSLTGETSARPDNLSEALYQNAKEQAAKLGLARYQKQQDLNDELKKEAFSSILKSPSQASKIMSALGMLTGQVKDLKNLPQPSGDIIEAASELPTATQNEGIKEAQKIKALEKGSIYAANTYEGAKDMPWYEGQGENQGKLFTIAESTLGRNLSATEKDMLGRFMPSRFDSAEDLSAKQSKFIEALNLMQGGTPILDSAGISTQPQASSGISAAEAAQLAQTLSSQGVSRDQIKIELQKRGFNG